MPNALRSAIDEFAKSFASSIVAAIRGSSLDEILALSGAAKAPAARGPGRPRASATSTRVDRKPTTRTVAAPAKKAVKSGRLARRSPEEIEKALELVVALVKSTKGGLRSEQIRAHLGMQKEELPRVLKEGLSTRQLKSKGQKRSTVYSAA